MAAETSMPGQWCLYLVRTATGALYTGISTDPERRLQEHEHGGRGARALRGRGPLTLVFRQVVGDRSAAQRAEAAVKRLSRQRKEELVAGTLSLDAMIDAVATTERTDA